MGYGIEILIQGSRACFTRPEMKAERVSYDVITPSAARGIMEAAYWKPEIKWHVDKIIVLNEIKFDTIRRNEVESKLSYGTAKKAVSEEAPVEIAASANRIQRLTTYLRDAAYLVSYHFTLADGSHDEEAEKKHYNIALRRLRKGQHFCQPVLGCREFPAEVSLVESGEDIPQSFYVDTPELDLGYMLYDLDFTNQESPVPLFYRAVMRNGVIDVAGAASEVVA